VVGNGPDRSAAGPDFCDASGPGRELAADLREQFLLRVRSVVRSALRTVDAAGLFLERHGNPQKARQAVLACANQARPRLSEANAWQYTVLAVPAGPSGEAVRDVANRALAEVPLTVVGGYEGVVFVQETASLSIAAAIAALGGDDPACAELAARMRSRADVDWAGADESDQALAASTVREKAPVSPASVT
jgi:hypothetical protein